MNEELRASDREREHAVARLRDASAEGRLTLDELVERTESAYAARTHGELVKVTADLPEPARESRPAVPGGRSRPRFVVAIFAPVRRRNRWRLARRTFVFSLFAPTFFELGDATLEGDEATITVLSFFAPVTVTVPPQIELETGVISIFAPLQERGTTAAPAPGAPRIRLNGLTIFAPVFVKYGRS
jgi:uncharacterized protein DUF1707